MTKYNSLGKEIQAAISRVVDGSLGDRMVAGAIAVLHVALFSPASWLLIFALLLTLMDYLAGRQKAKADGVYSHERSRAGINSKLISWVLLLGVWLLVAILLEFDPGIGVDMNITWLVPVYFTLVYIAEEFRSLDANLDHPNWLQPLILFLENVTDALSPRRRR